VCDVRYIESAAGNVTRKEKAVPLSRVTVTMPEWHSAHLDDGGWRESKRERQEPMKSFPESLQAKQKSEEPKSLKGYYISRL
jgi:hypothetical protein